MWLGKKLIMERHDNHGLEQWMGNQEVMHQRCFFEDAEYN